MKENTKKVEKGNHQKPTPDATKTAINLSSVEAFKNLGITEDLLISIAEQGFVEPTEIQTKSIPSVLSGMDLMAKASTGSGKTLAFGSGIIQNSERKKGLQALVLTPTRELAIQAAKALQEFSKHKSLSVSAIYGGGFYKSPNTSPTPSRNCNRNTWKTSRSHGKRHNPIR